MKELSVEEIQEKISTTLSDIAIIKSQLYEAKTTAAATGEYRDRDWFRRANTALRFKGREHQDLQIELARKKKEQKAVRSMSICNVFIELVKSRIGKEQFGDLMREATAIANGETVG